MTTLKKVTKLSRELKENLPNLSKPRHDLIALAILSIVQVCSISLVQIAKGMPCKAKVLSNFRRLQRFISGVDWQGVWLIKLIIKWLGIKGPYTLLIDRTHWAFGSQQINILCISVLGDGYSVPLAWSLLDKKGNSNQAERIALLKTILSALGSGQIAWILADREFGGSHWYNYLNDNKISFAIRIKQNQYVKRYGRKTRVTQVIHDHKRNGKHCNNKRYWLGDLQVYIHGFRIRNDKNKLEYLIIASQSNTIDVVRLYRDRWYIENMFKDMKSNGLRIEATHVQKLDRLHTLLGLIVLAQTWAIRVGEYIRSQTPKVFKKAKHKRNRKSVFRAGLDAISRATLTNNWRKIWLYIRFLSCT